MVIIESSNDTTLSVEYEIMWSVSVSTVMYSTAVGRHLPTSPDSRATHSRHCCSRAIGRVGCVLVHTLCTMYVVEHGWGTQISIPFTAIGVYLPILY